MELCLIAITYGVLCWSALGLVSSGQFSILGCSRYKLCGIIIISLVLSDLHKACVYVKWT